METSGSRKYIAELVGTFALVLIGTGSAVIAGDYIGNTGIAFAFGLTLLAMVYSIGRMSGCHINPAVTAGMLAAGKIRSWEALLYVIFQCAGAAAASAALWAIATGQADYVLETNGLGQNGYGSGSPEGYSMTACFYAEVVLTFLFVFVVLGATSKNAPPGFAGLAIGLALTYAHLVGIPITGTSVNPARSLGPAVIVRGDALSQLWLFWAAPLIGGILAAIIWRLAFEREKE